jgi:hypothetical protein
MAVLVMLITIFLSKVVPSYAYDASVMVIIFMLAIGILAGVQVGYSSLVEGKPEWPFGGLMMLVYNPHVLWNVIDDTSILPGTLTSDDILEGGS